MPRLFSPYLLTGLVYWLCISNSWAQAVFYMDSLPANGLVLDKAWKWHLGDKATWSQSDFDDTRWDSLNPTQNTATLTKLPQQGIGWLRLRLQIAPPMRGKLVGLLIRQKGAFDLFLNGKFIAQAGQISSQKQIALGVEKANLPYISLGTDSVQLLAIRYAFSNQQWPLIKRRDSFFEIRVVATELAQADSLSHRQIKISRILALFALLITA